MLQWRLIIGIPLVAVVATLFWLDAKVAPAPGLALIPFFLICVYFLCKEILLLLNAGGIYPRRTTIYLGVFGTIILCWASCYNSLPLIADWETQFVDSNRSNVEDASAENSLEKGGFARFFEKKEKKSATDDQIGASNDENDVENIAETLPSFSNEKEWKTAAFACVHTLLAIAAGALIAFVGEMLRFKLPGGHMINLSGAIFAIVYIGLLGSFMVMLRIAYGVAAVVSLIIVTKMCDVGAYTVGRLFGRHKMAPSLSPGKTIEGGIGGITFAILGAWFSTSVLFPLATGEASKTTWIGVAIYGLTVGLAGALGDLAESLIKRDVMRKDSGTNVPGFGGFLDVFDSLLLAAPVAFGLWAFHVIR